MVKTDSWEVMRPPCSSARGDTQAGTRDWIPPCACSAVSDSVIPRTAGHLNAKLVPSSQGHVLFFFFN